MILLIRFVYSSHYSFQAINNATGNEDGTENAFLVLSAFNKKGVIVEGCHSGNLCLAPTAVVHFISSSYRFVFSFDVSPSMAAVNGSNGVVFFQDLFLSFCKCLEFMCEPLVIPGCADVIQPELWVTAMAQTHPALQPLHPVRVIVQVSPSFFRLLNHVSSCSNCKVFAFFVLFA